MKLTNNKLIDTITKQPLTSTVIAGLFLQTFSVILTPWSKLSTIQIVIFIFVSTVLFSFAYHVIRYYIYLENFSVDKVRRKLARECRAGGNAARIYHHYSLTALRASKKILGEPSYSRSSWTTYSFDRCLALALIYPLLTALLAWVVESSSIGSIAVALSLPNELPSWGKGAFLLALILPLAFWAVKLPHKAPQYNSGLEEYQGARDLKRHSDADLERAALSFVYLFALAAIGIIIFLVLNYFTGIDPETIFLIITIQAMILAVVLPRQGTFGVGTGLFAIAWLYALIGSGFELGQNSSPIAVPLLLLAMIPLLLSFSYPAIGFGSKKFRFFLCLFCIFPLFYIQSFEIDIFFANGLNASTLDLSIILLFPILSMINGVFDWLSIGLTRFFIRAGTRMNGLWPLILGILDLVCGFLILAGLCFTLVLTANHFLFLAGSSAASVQMSLEEVLIRIETPAEVNRAENFWAYWIVFSTLIPSVINFTAGSLSLIRSNVLFTHKILTDKAFHYGKMDIGGILILSRLSISVAFTVFCATSLLVVFCLMLFHYIIPGYGDALFDIVNALST